MVRRSPSRRGVTDDRSGGGDIYVTNADGSGRQRLTTNPGPDSDPAWSPDGRKIAFVSGRDGNLAGSTS